MSFSLFPLAITIVVLRKYVLLCIGFCIINLANAAPTISGTKLHNDGLVQTPYGLLPPVDVPKVNQYETVKVSFYKLVETVDRNTGAVIKDYGPVPQDFHDDPYVYAKKLQND